MKKLLPKKYRRLLWAGLLVCLILYVLGSLLAPPLAGTQRKSDRHGGTMSRRVSPLIVSAEAAVSTPPLP